MREFFERHKIRLDVEDLSRLIRIVIDDLSSVLADYEIVVRLFDQPQREAELSPEIRRAVATNSVHLEADSGKIHIPVIYAQVPLALISAGHPQKKAPDPGILAFLPTILRLSIDKVLLYKICITDRETGLNNEYYFRSFLAKNLSAARQGSGPGQRKPLRLGDLAGDLNLTVILTEITDYDHLTANHGRLKAIQALKSLARGLREAAGGPICLARLAPNRLGLILFKEDPASGEALARKITSQRQPISDPDLPDLHLAVGLVNYPQDIPEESEAVDPSPPEDPDYAGQLLTKAELALNHALVDPEMNVCTYRDLLNRGGRIVQTLPYGRVVIDLGRMAGAKEGLVFTLHNPGPAPTADPKGEVILFDVQVDYSLGEVINLSSSLSRVQAGDRLTLSRTSAGEKTGQDNLDPLLGILDHQGFMNHFFSRLHEADQVGRFTIILARVDGYDRHRATMGHIESDRLFKALYSLLATRLSDGAFAGRFSSESLSFFCPDLTPVEALALAESWRDEVTSRLKQTCSFGLAVYPCGSFTPMEIVTNAQKAIDHATFLGPASVASFNAVSLNISGDRLFEAGDRQGAIKEYLQALELDPHDLNVLNSLGVCYGYQGKLETALETFARVIDLDPRNLMAHFNQGFALGMAGRRQEALLCLRQAAQIDPRKFDPWFELGKMALALDLVDEALEAFKQAAALEDRRPLVFRYLGQTLVKTGRSEEAIEAFKAAARHDPDDASSLSQLGVLFLERATDLDVALSLTRQGVDLDPTNGLFRLRLARALAACGHSAAAEAELRQAMDLGARGREVLFEMGRVIKEQGRTAEAEDWFKEALIVDKTYSPAAEALAEITQGGELSNISF